MHRRKAKQKNRKGKPTAAAAVTKREEAPPATRKATKVSTTIGDLNRDVLARVFTFLPYKDCLSITDLVSKAFHNAGTHPMCWDLWVNLWFGDDALLEDAVNFFTKYNCTPTFEVSMSDRSTASLETLSRLTNLRSLDISSVAPNMMPSVTAVLSSLNQLESFSLSAGDDEERQFAAIEFPNMPHLKTISLQSGELHTIVNLDTAHLPLLSQLYILCQHLEASSFPDSVKELRLDAEACSVAVLANISKLPYLESLKGAHAVNAVLSQPNLRFTSSLTTLGFMDEMSSQTRENIRRMTNLTSVDVLGHQEEVPAEDIEAVASLPSLKVLNAPAYSRYVSTEADLAPFRHAKSLQSVRMENFPSESLQYFAHPSLTSLIMLLSSDITSLAPLAACVNLTTLRTDVRLSEQDAQVLSGLTKLEKLGVLVTSEACLTHICKLPRLKLLKIDSYPKNAVVMGPVALQALTNLAPTIEKLALPGVADPEAAVLAACKLTRLTYFYTESKLSAEQVSLLRSSIPRLVNVVHEGLRPLLRTYLEIDADD